jgi:hypothetical protein
MGISVQNAGQQNVFRYNEITGQADNNRRWLMDGIGGGDNFGAKGAPGADSDIYQNIVLRVMDDAIEAEGGGRNVRVWGNYMSDVKVAVGATSAHFGPHYVWRNVVNRMRTCYQSISNTDSDWSATTPFKYGGVISGWGGGIRYLFHNTLLQQPSHAGGTLPEGAGAGIDGVSNGAGSVQFTIARNNLLHVRSATHFSVATGDAPTGSDFALNLYNGRYDSHLPPPDPALKFTASELVYEAGHGWSSVPALGGGAGAGTGNYQLDAGSKGLAIGELLPNFSDGFLGTKPDMGAHESDTPAMKFGISAGN